MRKHMETVDQFLAHNKCSVNIHFLHFSLALVRRQVSFEGLPASAVQITGTEPREKH